MHSHHIAQAEHENENAKLHSNTSVVVGPKKEGLKQSEEDFMTDIAASKSETNHKHLENYENEPRNLSHNANSCQESQLKNVAKEKQDQSTQDPPEQNQTDTNRHEQNFKVDQKGLQDQIEVSVEEQKEEGILEQDEKEYPKQNEEQLKIELQETQDKLEKSRKELAEYQKKSQQELESCKEKNKMEILEYQEKLTKCHEECVTMCTCI